MNPDRSWMYKRLTGGLLTPGYAQHAQEFVRFALRHPACMSGVQIKCPCAKRGCRNTSYRDAGDVELHILKNGFVKGYQVWVFHGEDTVSNDVEVVYENEVGDCSSTQRMILDAASPKLVVPVDETTNAEARKFSDTKDRYQGSSSSHQEVFLEGVKGHNSSSAFYEACSSRRGGSSYSQDQFDQRSVDELVEKRVQAQIGERVDAMLDAAIKAAMQKRESQMQTLYKNNARLQGDIEKLMVAYGISRQEPPTS